MKAHSKSTILLFSAAMLDAAIASSAFALMSFLSLSASAISLDEFAPVHKARVERKGPNDVVLVMNSGEWSSGLAWKSAGEDFSQARYLAVDVCDRPYPEMTRAARKIGGEFYAKRMNGVWGR